MKTFLVNLDRNPERLAFMDSQLRRLGIDYERVPAVDGRTLTSRDRRRVFAKWHSFFAENRRLTAGQIGCALSHVEVYRRMRNNGILSALVLEDDVSIARHFPSALVRASDFIDTDKPQVVVFSNWGNHNDDAPERIEKSPKNIWCTDAYLITLPAAKIIEHENFPVVTVADKWRRWERNNGVELYRIYPIAVRQCQETFSSGISNSSPSSLGLRIYLHFFGRINSVIDNLFRKCKFG